MAGIAEMPKRKKQKGILAAAAAAKPWMAAGIPNGNSRYAWSRGSQSGRRAFWAGLLAMVLAFALYAPTVRYDFVTLDDPMYVEDSQVVQDGFSWEGAKRAFTTAPENYWAPLLWFSFMADMEISGGEPWSFHLTNALLFSANVGLLFVLVRRWTGRTGVALATALLWAFHPTRVESVAWITARKDVLSGVFFFLGLWFYTIGWERRPRSASAATGESRDGGVRPAAYRLPPTAFIFFAWLCMLVGGMAKQIVILLPPAMLLLDVWPLGRTNWDRVWKDGGRLAAEKWAFWGLAIAYASLPIVFHVEAKAVMTVPAWHRAMMIPVHYLFYVGKLIWPTRLMPLQPDLPSWWELLMGAAAVLAGLTWAAWRWRRRFPLVLWGWLWFVVLLFPLSGVVWAGAERVATRWLYLPQIGLMLAGVVLAADWSWARSGTARRGVAVACALVLAIWGGTSLWLSHQWRSRDHFGIWAYECNPGHPVACMLGGDGYLAQKNWAQAAKAYETGSGFYETHCFLRLCMIWNCCGFPDLTDGAWPRFERGQGKSLLEAVADKRDLERIFIWRLRGQCMQARGDLAGALGAFKEALELDEDPEAFVVAEYLRVAHEAGKFDDEAAALAARMTKAAGEDRSTWKSLFPCYAQIWKDGARGYAYGYFLEHAQRHPDDAVAFNNMAWLLATAKPVEIGHARQEEWPAKAVEWAERAVSLEAGKEAATAWDTLGAARANAGDFAGAVKAATKGAALAREGDGLDLARQIEARIAVYRSGQPWRE